MQRMSTSPYKSGAGFDSSAAAVFNGPDPSSISCDIVKDDDVRAIDKLDVLVCPVSRMLQPIHDWSRKMLASSDLTKYLQSMELKGCREYGLEIGEIRISDSHSDICKRILHVVTPDEDTNANEAYIIRESILEACFETLLQVGAESAAFDAFEEEADIELLTDRLGAFVSSDRTRSSKLRRIYVISSNSKTLELLIRWQKRSFQTKDSMAPSRKTPNAGSLKRKVQAKDGGDSRNEEEDKHCPVCLEDFSANNRQKLPSCEHHLCTDCLPYVTRSSPICPVCRKPFGAVTGNQPIGATMNVSTQHNMHLPGYKKCGTIIIDYTIPSGTQTEEHPHPGRPFYGTTRRAFLPDNAEGQRVLELLRKAFAARLVFTVGRSITTGQEDVVTWNDIHHKTNTNGGPEHYGYPDATYLMRVEEDLAAKGIKL